MASDPLLRPLVKRFVEEADELCQKATRALLSLERTSTALERAPHLDALARALHTLKGTAATITLLDLSDIAHALEDRLRPYADGERALPQSEADVFLRALDTLLKRLDLHAQEREAELPDIASVIAALASQAPEPTTAAADISLLAERPEPPSAADDRAWRVDPRHVVAMMRDVERMREVRLRLDERRRELERAVHALTQAGLLSQTAEVRAQLLGISHGLSADSEESGAVVQALEEGLKAVSTLPLSTVLEPLHRAVRDLCRALGKRARLSIVGGEVSLDRRMVERLKGPLVHLVRNAVDHGIELPEERRKRGKHDEGAVVVRAEAQGNQLFLEVADDGAGLNIARIREVAARQGIADAAALARMDEGAVRQLVFKAGFSTRDAVTESSGRGVGLDVVANELHAMEGQVEVHSIEGQGTRFVLTLPTDFGGAPVLLVRCGEQLFALPLLAVESAIRATADRVRVSRQSMKLDHGEQLLDLVDLAAALQLRAPHAPTPGQPVLIVAAGGKRVAFAVDEVLGEQELAVRPLPTEVRTLAAYQGATTLARGELVLVLRPGWLVGTQQRVELVRGSRRALVVDDSLTARALHRSMLEAGGFHVHAVSSGAAGLQQLMQGAYDVVICDIGMEEMDGFQFTRTVRSRSDTRHLPLVLVSGRDLEEDRAAGLDAGADAYLSKKDCVSGRLLAQVTEAIARQSKVRAE